jgi:hypothetical protein
MVGAVILAFRLKTPTPEDEGEVAQEKARKTRPWPRRRQGGREEPSREPETTGVKAVTGDGGGGR